MPKLSENGPFMMIFTVFEGKMRQSIPLAKMVVNNPQIMACPILMKTGYFCAIC